MRILAYYGVVFWLLFRQESPVHAADTTTTVDDSDSGINYSSGGWSTIEGSNQVGGTVKLSRVAGATAWYRFTGTGISVFGTQGTPGGNATTSTYSIDGGSISQYIAPSSGESQYQVQFYASPTLENGPHILRITNLNDFAWFWLDFLKVTAPVASSPTSSGTSSSSPATSSQSGSSTGTSSASPTASSSSNSVISSSTTSVSNTKVADASSISSDGSFILFTTTRQGTTVVVTGESSPTAVAAIAASHAAAISTGAAVGIGLAGAALLVFVTLAALWWKRRHQRDVTEETQDIDSFGHPRYDMDPAPPVFPYQVEHFTSMPVAPSPQRQMYAKGSGASMPHGPRENVFSTPILQNGAALSDPFSPTTNTAASSSRASGYPFPIQYTSQTSLSGNQSSDPAPMPPSKLPSREYNAGLVSPPSITQSSNTQSHLPYLSHSTAPTSATSNTSHRQSTDGGVWIEGGPLANDHPPAPLVEGNLEDDATAPPAYKIY